MAKSNSLSGYIDQLAGGAIADRKAFASTNLTVNLSGLNDDLQMLASAKLALQAWTAAAGFTFQITTAAGADITFDNELPGAFAGASFDSDGVIFEANVNIEKEWMDGFPVDQRWGEGSYGTQTFIHEIGHALGLDHGGPYDGSGNYQDDAIFTIDTNQYSVMSYFEQDNFGGSSALNVMTPMLADIAAIRELYGIVPVNAGNTVYGLAGVYDFAGDQDVGRTIVDTGGIDLIDLRKMTEGARLDLNPGRFSDIGGHVNNLATSIGTVIERAYGTAFADQITGNSAANLLIGNAGADRIFGGAGNDVIEGGAGGDRLQGGAGADQFRYLTRADFAGDLILDFTHLTDKIVLTAIDANTLAANDQAFSFIARSSFSGTAGQLRYAFTGDDTLIAGDLNGDRVSDFTLRLDTIVALTADDFLL